MIKKYAAILFLPLLLFHFSLAKSDELPFNVKELKETGQIKSLEFILDKISKYNVYRLLEVELKRDDNQYVYEIEYINSRGVILEMDVDAVTAQVLKIEREY